MDEPSLSTPPSARPPEDRLDSWKEIAVYLKRDVTTVQRWEKREGMPVHRHVHDRIGSVYASRTELDAWARTRNLQGGEENGKHVIPPKPPPVTESTSRTKWRFVLPIAVTAAVVGTALSFWLQRTEHFWRNPIADAQFQTVTDFAGLEQAAAVSRDGHFVAFLSDQAGEMDVWVTQVGSGEFHNLTHGTVRELVNPSIRTLGFSPDGSLVTFWSRGPSGPNGGNIGIWAVPVLGGAPRPYLEGAAEFDWSADSSLLAYHTPGPGDPLFVSHRGMRPEGQPILTAPAGLHSHFPLWSPDTAFIYFVQGTIPTKLDVWRIRPTGGTPERITSHNGYVSHPILLDRHTLMYLANDSDGSGPWLYSMDVERRIPHRLTSGVDRYTSLAASADGHRLVATLETPKTTLWRWQIGDSLKNTDAPTTVSEPSQIALTTGTGFSPRLGPDYLLYASATGTTQSIWKLTNGASSELWRGDGSQVIGGPVISVDGRLIAFSVRQQGHSLLYVMQADGTGVRIVANSLDLQGAPAWSPDGHSIFSAANDHGAPHVFRVPIDGGLPAPLIREYSVDPQPSPDGSFIVYSGPDIGTAFSVKAFPAKAMPHPLADLTLTRGARHLAFLPEEHALVIMRGDLQHKDLWLLDLETGVERPLTHLPPDFHIRDFDIAPNHREVVLERVHENSNIVLLDLPRQ